MMVSDMASNPKDKEFSDREARERFERTLRGALSTPPKPLKDVPKKRDESQRKGRKPKQDKPGR
jgi:hypothetical protein